MERNGGEAGGTCLIVGCGYVGTRLARRLGPAALALVRSTASAGALGREGIRALALDLDAAQGAPPLPPLRAVVYLAPPSGAGTEDLRLGRLLEALGGARPEVLIYVGTTGVYGDRGGAPVDEESPVAPGEDRSRQRLDAEQRVSRWCGAAGVREVRFRVPAIYGPHRLPLDRLRRGEPVLRAGDSGPGNRIHVDDLVEALLAGLAGPAQGLFNLVDGRPESMAAFTARVAALAGLPPPREVSWSEAEALLSPGLLAFLRESRRVTSRRLGELGWAPRYLEPETGIRASLAEMGWVAPSPDGLSSAGR